MVEVPGDTHTVTCTRLTLVDGRRIFVRTQWFNASFYVTALDFPHSWSCNVTKQEVESRAAVWDISSEEYLLETRLHLEDDISDSMYSLQPVRSGDKMRLSWNSTAGLENGEPRVTLLLHEDHRTTEHVPEFLDALMDTTLILQELQERRKVKKVRQLAMRFSAAEKAKRRYVSQQAPTSGGLDGFVIKSEFRNSTGKFNSSTVSFEPASGQSTPIHPPSSTALEGRNSQHELRTPTLETLKSSPRQGLQSASSSKPLNQPMYNVGRQPPPEEETLPSYGHQTSFCFDRPNALGNYVGVSHGQVKSIPSGFHGSNESRREKGQADLQRLRALEHRSESVQVPMTDGHDYLLERGGTSQMKLPVKVDVYDGLDRGIQGKHSQEFTARSLLYEPELPWPPSRTPIRNTNVDHLCSISKPSPSSLSRPSPTSMSRPSPTCHDTGAHQGLQKAPTCDKVVISYESRKLDMENSGANAWKAANPRKPTGHVESKSFGLAGSRGQYNASQGRKRIIMLSDSEEEEDYHHNETGTGVMDDEDLVDRGIRIAVDGFSDEPESGFTIGHYEKSLSPIPARDGMAFHQKNMAGSSKDLPPFPLRRNGHLISLNGSKTKREHSRSRLESEDGNCQSMSRKRKERDDAHDIRTDIFAEGKRTKMNGFLSEEQGLTPRGSLPRHRNGLDAQVSVPGNTTAYCVKLENGHQSEQKPVNYTGDRNEKPSSTFNYESRAHCKPVNHTADHRPEKPTTSTFNHESRAQWNTWISEAKTEVPAWEVRMDNRDSTIGGSYHVENQHTGNYAVNTSSPSDSKYLNTPPSLKKLDRYFDLAEPQSNSEYHLQSARNPQNINTNPPSEGNSFGERQEVLARTRAEQPEISYTREMVKNMKEISSEDDIQLETVKVERREFIQIENEGDSDSVEEHVFEAGECDDDEETTRARDSVANVLNKRHKGHRENSGSLGRKLPGRRGRPPGTKSQLRPKPTQSLSQGVNICNDETMMLKGRPGRPLGRPRQCTSQALSPPIAEYVVKKSGMVDEDRELQEDVPDSDYYCFDGDRIKENIKPNQIWALYDEIDAMPRTLIRIKEVDINGPFWVKASWLQPRKKKTGGDYEAPSKYPISCGDFEVPKENTIVRVLNCFSHRMEFTPKSDTVVQIYPRVGEIWALHHKEDAKQARPEKDKHERAREKYGNYFRLVVILSECGAGLAPEIQVLRKRSGFRTLWEPGYNPGPLPLGHMERLSHKVPAYKLTGKDYPHLKDHPNLECWDIDAAAVPTCQRAVT